MAGEWKMKIEQVLWKKEKRLANVRLEVMTLEKEIADLRWQIANQFAAEKGLGKSTKATWNGKKDFQVSAEAILKPGTTVSTDGHFSLTNGGVVMAHVTDGLYFYWVSVDDLTVEAK